MFPVSHSRYAFPSCTMAAGSAHSVTMMESPSGSDRRNCTVSIYGSALRMRSAALYLFIRNILSPSLTPAASMISWRV